MMRYTQTKHKVEALSTPTLLTEQPVAQRVSNSPTAYPAAQRVNNRPTVEHMTKKKDLAALINLARKAMNINDKENNDNFSNSNESYSDSNGDSDDKQDSYDDRCLVCA